MDIIICDTNSVSVAEISKSQRDIIDAVILTRK